MCSTRWVLAALISIGSIVAEAAPLIRLSGHVAEEAAAALTRTPAEDKSAQPLTLTLVLRRDDEAGFQRFLDQLYDPASPQFRRFLTPVELSARFGPSPDTYRRLQAWLSSQGLQVVERSPDRMTLTVRGTTAAAQKAFSVRIAHGSGKFLASLDEPALPADLAPSVLAVNGLTRLQEARPLTQEQWDEVWCSIIAGNIGLAACQAQHPRDPAACATAHKDATDKCITDKKAERANNSPGSPGGARARP